MVERKKRGLGRGLGALIPDANSSDRPVDVFFSGGNADDSQREKEQKAPRAARTDPAASMQSSRRRKPKAAAESKTSGKTTASSSSSKPTARASSTGESKSASGKSTTTTAKTSAGKKTSTTKSTAAGKSATTSKSAATRKTAAKAKESSSASTSTSKSSKPASTKSARSKAANAKTAAGSKTNASASTESEATDAKAAEPKPAEVTTSAMPAQTSSSSSPSTDEAVNGATPASGEAQQAATASEPAEASEDVREMHPGVYTSSGNADPNEEEFSFDPKQTTVVVSVEDDGESESEGTEGQSSSVSAESSVDSSEDNGEPDDEGESYEGVESIPDTEFGEIDVELIDANPRQPRTVFDEDLLAELVHSIREIGVLQPVVVRQKPSDHSRFELIMGERRLRATKDAGLTTIPAIIRYVEDTDLLRDALLENLHRAELNPLEEAAAYGQLLEDFGCTQEELSERIGRSRPQISNTLRLLRLPPLVQRRVAAGVISAGHARAILGLRDPEHMEVLAQRIVAEGLSVRASEEAVVLLNRGDSINVSRATSKVSPEFLAVAERLGDRLDTKVNITVGKRKGKLSVEFANQEDLDRILNLLGIADGEAL